MRIAIIVVCGFLAAACSARKDESVVWFVQATDPHLFIEAAKDVPSDVQRYQARLNDTAFSTMLRYLGSLQGTERPAFLVLTGDLGIDPTAAGTPGPEAREAKRREQVDLLTTLLRTSPVSEIFVIPGNNDVEQESAADSAVSYDVAVLAAVEAALEPSGIRLHDLGACYGQNAGLSGCYGDVAGTKLRLVGVPSYSFKNRGQGVFEANRPKQERDVERLGAIVARADSERKEVLLVSHIPALDDPYTVAQELFTGRKPPQVGNIERPPWSAWNVSPTVFRRWKEIAESAPVLGVLAGHFHDSHREIYYPPYTWSTKSRLRPDPRNVFVAPPLAVKLQDASPIQARGFALFRIERGELTRRLYWYDQRSSTFRPDPEPAAVSRPSWVARAADWVWNQSNGTKGLGTLAVIAIAFLAAFLTVVGVWQIPPAETRLTAPRPEAGAAQAPGAPQLRGAAQTPSTTGQEARSAFDTNFAKTVISGVGGMLAVAFLEPLWQEGGSNAKALYLIFFTSFFIVFLVFSAALRGLTEALRSRVITEHRLPPEAPWHRRAWSWLLSWRSSSLIFLDTSFNVVQGKNQLRTAVFGDTILDYQSSLVRVADRVREEVDAAVRQALAPQALGENAVRVSISVLATDGSFLFYISRAPRSLRKFFDPRSVAFVAVWSGEARWWKASYLPDAGNIILFDNSPGVLPGEPKEPLLLKPYFQEREARDYEAFLILPIPWFRRGLTKESRKAGIHVSFQNEADLTRLLRADLANGGPLAGSTDTSTRMYPPPSQLSNLLEEPVDASPASTEPWILDLRLRAALRESVAVLGELLQRFNDEIFHDHISPRL